MSPMDPYFTSQYKPKQRRWATNPSTELEDKGSRTGRSKKGGFKTPKRVWDDPRSWPFRHH